MTARGPRSFSLKIVSAKDTYIETYSCNMLRKLSFLIEFTVITAVLIHRSHSFSPYAVRLRHARGSASVVNMSKEVVEIKTDKAPSPVGPYSQALLVGSTLYCSGSLSLDPTTGEFVDKGDIQGETRQVLKNLGAVLEAAGGSSKNIVRCTIFLADLGDFAKMNEVYAEFFKDNTFLPTRTCVQAGALPKDALIEIDCIAEL